jgi:hypothetical protein
MKVPAGKTIQAWRNKITGLEKKITFFIKRLGKQRLQNRGLLYDDKRRVKESVSLGHEIKSPLCHQLM